MYPTTYPINPSTPYYGGQSWLPTASAPPVEDSPETLYSPVTGYSVPSAAPTYPQPVSLEFPMQVFPPRTLLTQAIHQQTLKLLSYASTLSASILSRDILPPASPTLVKQQSSTVKRESPLISIGKIDLSDRSWRMFNSGDTYISPPISRSQSDSKRSQESDDMALRLLVGGIGMVVALASIFFLGKAMAEKEDAQEDSFNFNEWKGQWQIQQWAYHSNPDYQALVNRIVQRAEAIIQRKETKRAHNITLLTLACLAGGTAVTGAFIGIQAMMAAGLAIGLFTGLGAAYQYGYHSSSTRDQKDAEAIEQAFIEMKSLSPLMIYS